MDTRQLYDERYCERYRALYVDHPQWRDKHAANVRIARSLLRPGARWLDLCCGQAYQFAAIDDDSVRKTGVDLSAAQLERARRDNPTATFVEGDVLACDLGAARFELVTCFWGAYSYLDDVERIAAFVRRAIGWTAPGGALYVELITPSTLAAFEHTGFAVETGCSVRLRSADGVAWSYRDPGGWHDLTSPPPELFASWLAPWFDEVATRGVVTTLQQLVATGRSDERVIDRQRR